MDELPDFQRFAAERIVDRLTDEKGSRRFLLADEVGLGKTIVAREVIQRLLEKKKNLVVVYLCSNSEIADQNRDKLAPGEKQRALRRVTQLAIEPIDGRGLQLYSFTPGTSLKSGPGMFWERQLVLYLVHSVLGHQLTRPLREFFRCGVRDEEWWHGSCRPAALSRQFSHVSEGLEKSVRAQWRRPVPIQGENDAVVLADVLESEVEAFAACPEQSARRNRVVAALRQGLQRAAVDYLEPDLVLLDEVQRFKDVLEEEHKADSIARQLFNPGGRKTPAAVLILSATPYKMLTLRHEENAPKDAENHHADFLATVAFLQRLPQGERPRLLDRLLQQFETGLRSGLFLQKGGDSTLRKLKRRIEVELSQVMSRTERNWYLEDLGKGVREIFSDGRSAEGSSARGLSHVPAMGDLADYVRTREFLLNKVQHSFQITDYWKSCPSVLTFMDAGYGALRDARASKALPEGVVTDRKGLNDLRRNHHRFAALESRFMGSLTADEQWRFLWLPPTVPYWKSEFFPKDGLSKFLVFSGWRFVPKAISILMSSAIEARLDFEPEAPAPLRFGDKRSFFVFDLCFPSVALAKAVSPAAMAMSGEIVPTDVEEVAYAELRKRVADPGLKIALVDGASSSTWQIVARLESNEPGEEDVRDGLAGLADDESKQLRKHGEDFISWMLDRETPLRVSDRQLRRLARIAAFSPSVSLLRASWSAFPEDCASRLPAGFLGLCLHSLRNYFNRPIVQAVVRARDKADGKFGAQVLDYCRDANLQAVLDEFLFLLADQPESTVGGAIGVLRDVFALGMGTPSINTRRKAGGGVFGTPETLHAHVALAFGDEGESDEAPDATESKTGRLSSVRKAFNSPFWPFVLATTSKGQEGLDFHLYCRDIVHWNLPSNPVDLEQREGRVNRRNSQAIRCSIAADLSLREASAVAGAGENSWRAMMRAVEARHGKARHKHGLFPRWVYAGEGLSHHPIRRHLVFFDGSEDQRRYESLKERLTLYRLVFGQPRQQDLLESLAEKVREAEKTNPGVSRTLSNYMINLSPLPPGYALQRARQEADEIIADGEVALRKLVDAVNEIVAKKREELATVETEIRELADFSLASVSAAKPTRVLQESVAALVYLRDPYDDEFDFHAGVGFSDDMDVVRAAHARLKRL